MGERELPVLLLGSGDGRSPSPPIPVVMRPPQPPRGAHAAHPRAAAAAAAAAPGSPSPPCCSQGLPVLRAEATRGSGAWRRAGAEEGSGDVQGGSSAGPPLSQEGGEAVREPEGVKKTPTETQPQPSRGDSSAVHLTLHPRVPVPPLPPCPGSPVPIPAAQPSQGSHIHSSPRKVFNENFARFVITTAPSAPGAARHPAPTTAPTLTCSLKPPQSCTAGPQPAAPGSPLSSWPWGQPRLGPGSSAASGRRTRCGTPAG